MPEYTDSPYMHDIAGRKWRAMEEIKRIQGIIADHQKRIDQSRERMAEVEAELADLTDVETALYNAGYTRITLPEKET